MTDKELLNFSAALKQQADEIVSNFNLLTIANKYAECHQIGSSVMDLMVDEDIDFICYEESEVDIDKCFAFAKELVTTQPIQLLKIKNYLEKVPYYQFKVYIEPLSYKDRDWKIAFSFRAANLKISGRKIYDAVFQHDVKTIDELLKVIR